MFCSHGKHGETWWEIWESAGWWGVYGIEFYPQQTGWWSWWMMSASCEVMIPRGFQGPVSSSRTWLKMSGYADTGREALAMSWGKRGMDTWNIRAKLRWNFKLVLLHSILYTYIHTLYNMWWIIRKYTYIYIHLHIHNYLHLHIYIYLHLHLQILELLVAPIVL